MSYSYRTHRVVPGDDQLHVFSRLQFFEEEEILRGAGPVVQTHRPPEAVELSIHVDQRCDADAAGEQEDRGIDVNEGKLLRGCDNS